MPAMQIRSGANGRYRTYLAVVSTASKGVPRRFAAFLIHRVQTAHAGRLLRTFAAGFVAAYLLAAAIVGFASLVEPASAPASASPPCIADDLTLMQAIGSMTREKALNDAALADPEYVERHLRGTREQLAEMSRHQQVVLSYFANEAKACLR